MIWFVVILLLIVVKSARLEPAGRFNDDYISRSTANNIKGIFVFLILISHAAVFCPLTGTFDAPYVAFKVHMQQLVVVMFFFYSGYGITEQIKQKGADYIKRIPLHRFLPVLINTVMAVLLLLILQTILGEKFSLDHILLSLIGYYSLGSSYWYMFAILVCYLLIFIGYIPHIIAPKKATLYISQAITTVLIILFVYWQMRMDRPWWTFDTIIIIAVGGWYSIFKDQIEKVFMHSNVTYLLFLVIGVALYTFSSDRNNNSIYDYSLWAGAFCLIVLLLTMKIRFSSTFLEFLGQHIFPIYMLQRIPMIIMDHIGFSTAHEYLFVVISFLATLLMITPFEKLSDLVLNKALRLDRR